MFTTSAARGSLPDRATLQELQDAALPLADDASLDPLLERIGDARLVLLGEASHGTSEYYRWRTRISRRLIREEGFSFIAVEGDWPDCRRVDRYIKAEPGSPASARAALHAYQRWPTWMWANLEVEELTEWLRRRNEVLAPEHRAGFYGLDVYSLWDSLAAILDYLRKQDGGMVESALRAFRCFEPHGEDLQSYGWSSLVGESGCEDAVARLLSQLRQEAQRLTLAGGRDAYFDAEQNALVARDAERYYRVMVRGGPGSWNLRDHHMMDTLERLLEHHGPRSRAIVWAHNTHVGDARATDMADAGMTNIGQLARERYAGEGVVLVGFGSHHGTVIAGRHWGAPMERLEVPPAPGYSLEGALHTAAPEDRLLFTDQAPRTFGRALGHRAIGVVYNPENEQFGNYVPTVLSARYDAFLFLDETRAVRPLHMDPVPATHMEPPETYPSGV